MSDAKQRFNQWISECLAAHESGGKSASIAIPEMSACTAHLGLIRHGSHASGHVTVLDALGNVVFRCSSLDDSIASKDEKVLNAVLDAFGGVSSAEAPDAEIVKSETPEVQPVPDEAGLAIARAAIAAKAARKAAKEEKVEPIEPPVSSGSFSGSEIEEKEEKEEEKVETTDPTITVSDLDEFIIDADAGERSEIDDQPEAEPIEEPIAEEPIVEGPEAEEEEGEAAEEGEAEAEEEGEAAEAAPEDAPSRSWNPFRRSKKKK